MVHEQDRKRGHTKDVRSSVHAEVASAGCALATTTGGMRLHRRNAREKPSKMESGSSSSLEGAGTAGRESAAHCIAA